MRTRHTRYKKRAERSGAVLTRGGLVPSKPLQTRHSNWDRPSCLRSARGASARVVRLKRTQGLGIDEGLVRLSVGGESIDDLLAELEEALS